MKEKNLKHPSIYIYIYTYIIWLPTWTMWRNVVICWDVFEFFFKIWWLFSTNYWNCNKKSQNFDSSAKERKGGWGVQKCDGVTTFLIHYTPQYGPNSVAIHTLAGYLVHFQSRMPELMPELPLITCLGYSW